MSNNEPISNFKMADLPSPKMQDIYQHWLKMKGERDMPSRADLNPADITPLLPHISLVDAEPASQGDHRFKFRLVGTETVKAMGIDVTGEYLNDLPQMKEFVTKRYMWLVNNKRPYIYFDKLKWSDKSFLDYSTIALPLSNNGTDVDIIMFGMFYNFPFEDKTKPYPVKME